MESRERDLRQALCHWREMKMIEEDLDGDDFFGPQIIMANKILDRIVDLAHHLKLTTIDSLTQQTNWCYSLDYGPEVIQIINTHLPPPPAAHPPPITSHLVEPVNAPILASSNTTNISPAPLTSQTDISSSATIAESAKRSARKCGSCESPLHIGT